MQRDAVDVAAARDADLRADHVNARRPAAATGERRLVAGLLLQGAHVRGQELAADRRGARAADRPSDGAARLAADRSADGAPDGPADRAADDAALHAALYAAGSLSATFVSLGCSLGVSRGWTMSGDLGAERPWA